MYKIYFGAIVLNGFTTNTNSNLHYRSLFNLEGAGAVAP